jgi:glycosyltransferase involved in cell wall biosynthesis
MGKDKIAFVVQRYGNEVNGGAEYHCRVLAEHMSARYEVDVLTSCAIDSKPWDNYYREGNETINNVSVHRFRVEKIKNLARFSELTERMKKNDSDIEIEWVEEMGPCCPSCIQYLKEHGGVYKAVIFVTYPYYTTIMGLKLELPNSICMPTAHDEPNIYLPVYKKMFKLPKAYLYNSIEERKFLYEKFNTETKLSRLTCVGIDEPVYDDANFPQDYLEYKGDYILYLGRVSRGKYFYELSKFFIEYKQRNPSNLKLLVAGKIDNRMNLIYSKDIIYVGFISDEEKNALLKNAKLLVMPSKFESLSLVILESMMAKRPVLVNGNCEVLKGQCIRSNAGLYYTDYFEFEYGLNYILNNNEAYQQMCENGYEFVKSVYDWDKVVDNVAGLIEELNDEK